MAVLVHGAPQARSCLIFLAPEVAGPLLSWTAKTATPRRSVALRVEEAAEELVVRRIRWWAVAVEE